MIHFPDYIRKHAFRRPNHRALHFEGRDFTWAQYCARLHGIAQALVDLGVAPGDRVAYLGQNSHWIAESYFSPSLIGAISVPLNYRLAEDEMVEVIADCTPEVLIVDRHFQDRAAALMQRCPSLKHLIFADWDAPDAVLPGDTLIYEDLVKTHSDVSVDAFTDRASRNDDTIIIFYTSGTTGVPKGVMLSHANMMVNATAAGHLYGFQENDHILLSGPLFHLGSGSRIYTHAAYGSTLVIQPKFEVEEAMEMIQDHRITTVTLVPTMLNMIMDHPNFDKFDFSSIRCLTYGAAPMPIRLIERAMEAIPGLTFCQGYGMTETSPVVTVLPPADHVPGNPNIDKLGSVGKPVLYCEVRIVDENDNPLPDGQPGEVLLRGPQVMNGYWKRPEDTAHAMRGGFYHTGDAGYLDEDGYLFLVGRTKEMIISGGENVYPIETENCLSKHPQVAQAAVLGIPHPKWGEEVHAVVSLREGATVTAEELIAFAKEKIAGYKAPRGITFWQGDLPLSPTNKIDKKFLKSQIVK
jgi:acyl-CoA synthetase (AMP-forming)/AMP-acid ligase II